ncbi:MAG: type I secretion system permease/ATPase [Gammaproteobacteria bacterium]|nr:type I secretion system permease/ATPase [Gammaproteobacteria bacterium]
MPVPNDKERRKTELDQALSASRGIFAAVGLFSFFINGLMLTVPLYMLQIYDRVLVSRSEHTLLMLTLVAGGLLLALGVLELARSRVLVRIGAKLDSVLTRPLLTGILSNRLQGNREQGQPIGDLDALRVFLTGPGLLSFFDAPWTPFFILVIFIFHPLLGFIALGGAVTLFGLALLSELITRRPLREASQISLNANAFAESSLRNAEVIQGMGMLPGLLRRWLGRHETALALQAVASDRAGGITATAKFVRQLLQIGVLGVGSYLAIREIITPGVMIVASIIMARALAPIEMAINSWRSFISARTGYARLQRILALQAEKPATLELPKPNGTLTLEGVVALAPGGEKPIIKGISFSIDAGSMLAIIGPSAAGKSTLARLLVGVWTPSAGNVRLDGADVTQWDHDALGPHIGYLPQDVELFEGTVSENIARFTEPDPEQVVTAARRAGVHEMILRLPNGYDSHIGEAGSWLSGGQRQRIALARALYGNPAFIVLDEPNASLDGEGEAALRATMAELKAAGRTLVVIAHRPSIIGLSDQILLLRDGRIEKFGPAQDILKSLAAGTPRPVSLANSMEAGSQAPA